MEKGLRGDKKVIYYGIVIDTLTTKYTKATQRQHKGNAKATQRKPQRRTNRNKKAKITKGESKKMQLEEIFKKVLDCSFLVHTSLGPGLLESAYLECLYNELIRSGLKVEKQKPLPLIYKEVKLDAGYRIDLLVEDKVVVEIKSIEALGDKHMAQILTYLKLSGCRLGLLANFNVLHLKDGIKRIIL
jgi:GxxExxY protein